MRLLLLFTSLVAVLFLDQCANPFPPSGGQKDTIPPTLVKSIPEQEALNFSKTQIQFTFDEFINADQLTSNLIITPNQEIKFKHLIKKNTLTLKFQSELTDSTTYTLNFFNSVTDVTERNPVINFIYSFSTGPFIDSLSVSGTTKDLWSQEIIPEVTVALYLFSDTLSVSTTKPKYFIKSDKEGKFKLTNIKSDIYKVFAFLDENNNLLFDTNTEPHAFLPDSVNLKHNKDSIAFQLVLLNTHLPKLINARPLADFYQARYNKQLIGYNAKSVDTTYTVYSKLEEDRESIKFYHEENYPDSLQVIITVQDTIGNLETDSLYIRFLNSKRRKEKFTVSTLPTIRTYDDTLRSIFQFNKPVLHCNTDSILLTADTLYAVSFDQLRPILSWNHNFMELETAIPFSWLNYNDTIKSILLNLNRLDSTDLEKEIIIGKIDMRVPGSTFTSVEKDTADMLQIEYMLDKNTESGTINYELSIDYGSFIVQLINENFKVISEIRSLVSGSFTNVPTGQYGLRILIDIDEDGEWSNANFSQDIPAEPVFIFNKFTELRNNWVINIGTITVP